MVLHRTEMNDTTLENEDLRLQACFMSEIWQQNSNEILSRNKDRNHYRLHVLS